MVLPNQIEALLDYLECHRELALGHFNRSKEGRELSRRQWNEIALILNSMSSDSPAKKGAEWRLYFNEYKYKCLKKIKGQKQEQNATGGEPGKKYSLTPSQDRLYNILHRDIRKPLLPGLRHVRIKNLCRDEPTPSPARSPILQCSEAVNRLPRTTSPLVPLRHNPESRANPERRRQRQPRRKRALDFVQVRPLQEQLERLERVHTKAIMAQTRATNRLAEAIERLSEAIVQ